jgi:hypothetical protein
MLICACDVIYIYFNRVYMSALPDLLACHQIALTPPVASASAERSFSTMCRIKTYLRSSMDDERLSSLAIIAVERQLTEVLMQNPSKSD